MRHQVGAAFSTQSNGGTAFACSPGIGYKFSDVIDLVHTLRSLVKKWYNQPGCRPFRLQLLILKLLRSYLHIKGLTVLTGGPFFV